MVSDNKAEEDSIGHEQGEVLMTLTKSRDGAKLESVNDPNPKVILMFPSRQGSSKNIGMRALIDMHATGALMKKSLFDSLKYKTLDEPKAKTWTMGAGMFVTKKKVVISVCLSSLIMTKHSFRMEMNSMQDSNQPYAVIISRYLMHQLQLKQYIIKNMI